MSALLLIHLLLAETLQQQQQAVMQWSSGRINTLRARGPSSLAT